MKITVRIILEIVGAPKEHVEKTMVLILEKLRNEEDLKVLREKTYETEQVKAFWSTFSEIEMEINDLETLTRICFNYMPSSIEILEPNDIKTNAKEITNIFNDLMGKLHAYDMIIKDIHARKKLEELKKQSQTKVK